MNGADQETYLGLSGSQIRAIVQIVDGTDPNGGQCSGAFVNEAWVVTAKHCLAISLPKIVVKGDAQIPSATFPVVRHAAHPTEDMALLQVDFAAGGAGEEPGHAGPTQADAPRPLDDAGPPTADAADASIEMESGSGDPRPAIDGGPPGVSPFEVARPAAFSVALGDLVEMAGFGITLSSRSQSLEFLVEPVTEIDAERITVDGFGESGACNGDSGGPLLVRDTDGRAVVLGVLSVGSGTCVDHDRYVRLDALRDWIESVVGPYVRREQECGTIGAQGRCLYGSAMWCSGAKLVVEACAAVARCGWDVAQSGFRCVLPSADRCDGVDSVGACVSGTAEWCNGGVLQRQSCQPCSSCRVEGRTGRPICSGVSDAGRG